MIKAVVALGLIITGLVVLWKTGNIPTRHPLAYVIAGTGLLAVAVAFGAAYGRSPFEVLTLHGWELGSLAFLCVGYDLILAAAIGKWGPGGKTE